MAYTAADVNAWYQAVQFRTGPTATVNSYVALLNNGTMTPATVQSAIISDSYTTANANSVIRLYQSAFNRVPDQSGQSFWVNGVGSGQTTLQTMANQFANSAEFQAVYGNQSASDPINAAILTAFYQNVLNRTPDDAGYQYWLNSGLTVGQVLNQFAQSAEFKSNSNAAITLYQQAEIAQNFATSGTLFQYGGYPQTTYILTTGIDAPGAGAFTKGAPQGNAAISGTFNSGSTTFTPGDNIVTTGVNNTLTLTDGNANVAKQDVTSVSASVSGVQTVTVNGSNELTFNAVSGVTKFSGLTQLNVNNVGETTITAAATTGVTETNTALAGKGIIVNGGAAVAVTATGALNNGGTAIAVNGAAGAVSVSNTSAGNADLQMGKIVVSGGTTVNVTQAGGNQVNTTTTLGAVEITGTAATTSVTVNNAKAATKSGTVAGIANNSVAITDVNAGSATAAGTIKSVSVSGYTTIGIADTALTTLSLANGSGNVIIDNSGLTTPTNKTLAVTVNGLTGGVLDDADIYTTLNVTTAGANSTLANVTFGGTTALTVAGDKVLTLTSAAGLTALKTATISGAAGLTADLSAATITAVDASGTSGNNTLTIDAAKATYVGGSGVDKITLSASAPTKTVTLGKGDDILDITAITATPTAALTGGDGTDTLIMTAANAATASATPSFAGIVSGFEHVTLTGATNQTVDLAVLGNFNYVTTKGGNGLTLNNIASGGTLELNGAGTAYTVVVTGSAAGSNDTLNLKLTDGSNAGVAFAATGITAANVENINIAVADTQATPTGTFLDTVTLLGNSATTIKVSGNAGLNLTATDTAATTVDASGITLGGFTYTSGALANAAAISGSATGTNTVVFSAATKAVTYTGGTGADTVTGNNAQDNIVTLGAGNNTGTFGGGANTVTAGSGNDSVTVGNGNNTVNLGDGTNAFTAGSGNNTYVGGSGVDTVTVGAGVNTITTGTGADVVVFTAPVLNVNSYSTIKDAHAGETITLIDKGTEVFNSTKVVLANTAVFQDYANAVVAAGGNASVNGKMGWFQYGGDTYLVESLHDGSVNPTFVNGTDTIVKLTGLIDLSTATNGGTNSLVLA